MPRIFISVAEASADEHAAALILKARELLPDCTFYGLTGPRMAAVGAQSLGDITGGAVMLSRVLGKIGDGLRIARMVERDWRKSRPDLVILLDSSALHLGLIELRLRGLAGRARKLGIPTLYYIAPQTWASRSYRNAWIRTDVTRVACIFPFEAAYLQSRGINATYVGQPVFERLRAERPDAERVAALRNSALGASIADGRVVGLMPGSRDPEIRRMLPLQLEIIRRLRARDLAVGALVSCGEARRAADLRAIVKNCGISAEVVVADNTNLIAASDLVFVKSGTGTLLVAQQRKPMIVMYHAGAIGPLYRPIGRRVLATTHFAMPNILAGARIVPEFMIDPRAADIVPIADELLRSGPWRDLMIQQIDAAVRPLEDTSPTIAVCEMIRELLPASAGRAT